MAVPNPDQAASIALQRFGLGARSGERKQVAADPSGWLEDQLKLTELPRIENLALKTSAENFKAAFELQAQRQAAERQAPQRAAAAAAQAMEIAMGGMAAQPAAAAAQQPAPEALTFRGEVGERFKQLTDSRVGFLERLTMFWSNHFAVSVAKSNPVRVTAAAYEREAIRPHVLGKFADMLLAAEQHPTMLLFLDNAQSIGPNSQAGRRRGRGINENLAREILELHTLGVGGGYTQADVTSFARVITGWSMVGPQGQLGPIGTFVFNPNIHEPGAQPVMGKSYADTGMDQGKSVLRDLARHPSTARHIATKLVRHFIADEPPAAAADRVAKAFLDSDGDLPSVYRALVSLPEALTAAQSKMRSPQEFIAAAFRAVGKAGEGPQILLAANMMGHTVWMPPGPNGYSDLSSIWSAPENMKARLDIAARMGNAAGGNVNPSELAADLYGEALSRETAQAIARAESKQQGLALLFMSPEFQRR